MAETKKTETKKRRKKTIAVMKNLKDPDISNTDIGVNLYDWGENCKLTDKQKLFVVWYTYPGRTYHNAYQSALKAGYKKNSAVNINIIMKRNPNVMACIKKFDAIYVKESLEDFYHKALHNKIARALYDIADFYEKKTYTDNDGGEHEYLRIKAPEDLTEEQRKCIDGIKYNNNGTPMYEFANRTHETDVLMRLHELMNGEQKKDGVEAELTIEQIKDKVTTKLKIIQKKDEEEILAGTYIDEPENLVEEA